MRNTSTLRTPCCPILFRSHYPQQEGGQEPSSWEGKSTFLFHLDLVGELMTHTLTLAHYLHIWCIHGFAFQLVSGEGTFAPMPYDCSNQY